MDYHDPDPERRNLVVMSIAFLIYFIGDGEFKNGNINFQIINLHLNNLQGIAYISWGLLFWFFYRYMLKYSSSFFTVMTEELSNMVNRRYIRNFVSKELKVELAPIIYYPQNARETEEGWVLTGMWYFKRHYHIRCSHLKNVQRNMPSGKLNLDKIEGTRHRGDGSGKTATLRGWKGWFVFLRLLLDYCFTKPNFSTNLLPILLFFIVVGVGVWKIYS